MFGWQRPCYLLGEGYTSTLKELMEDTAWDNYGTGNYEKCADCMVHSGYESTAVMDAVKRPLHILKVALKGPQTEGEMAPEIPLDRHRGRPNTCSASMSTTPWPRSRQRSRPRARW